MRYFITILPPDDDSTAYSVVVPDIPGCFSAGDTLEQAIENSEEAIVMQLEAYIERGEPLPDASTPEQLALGEYKGNIFVGVEISPSLLSSKAKRINVTIPEGVLYLIDREAEKNHINRSAFLTEAALSKIQNR